MEPCYTSQVNKIYNHNFVFPSISGEFAAGWQKCKRPRSSSFYREKTGSYSYAIRITNKSTQLASICQQRCYKIPVYERQIWEAGAVLKTSKKCCATIIVHFINSASTRTLHAALEFIVEPEEDYYYGVVSIPPGSDYVYLELGIKETGTLWIEDVIFKRIFPVGEYDVDPRGRLNINTVEKIKQLVDPVKIQGPVEVKGHFAKPSREFVEDVVACSNKKNSTVQDILLLNIYSFCTLNQGKETIKIQLQISPDAANWINDGPEEYVGPGELKIFVPQRFLRYTRLLFSTKNKNTSNLRIFFQGQG